MHINEIASRLTRITEDLLDSLCFVIESKWHRYQEIFHELDDGASLNNRNVGTHNERKQNIDANMQFLELPQAIPYNHALFSKQPVANEPRPSESYPTNRRRRGADPSSHPIPPDDVSANPGHVTGVFTGRTAAECMPWGTERRDQLSGVATCLTPSPEPQSSSEDSPECGSVPWGVMRGRYRHAMEEETSRDVHVRDTLSEGRRLVCRFLQRGCLSPQRKSPIGPSEEQYTGGCY